MNRKTAKKAGGALTPPAVLCPPLKILLPAWIADRFSAALPLPQAGLGNACEPAKRLFLHAQFLAVCGNALYLSIQAELIKLVHQIRQRDFVVGRQILRQLQGDGLCDPGLSMDIDIPLRQSPKKFLNPSKNLLPFFKNMLLYRSCLCNRN